MSLDITGDPEGPPANPDPDQTRWNEKYRREGFESFGTEPSSWLVDHEELLRAQPRGPVLDVAAGNGRNALYLARLGFEFEALDISDLAVAWLQEQARRQRLSVCSRWANLQIEVLPEGQYEVVVNINYLERRILPALKAALRPRGLLFFETMTTDQLDLLGRRMAREFLLAPNELRDSFSDLETLEYREGLGTATKSGKKRAVASLVARKPGAWTSRPADLPFLVTTAAPLPDRVVAEPAGHVRPHRTNGDHDQENARALLQEHGHESDQHQFQDRQEATDLKEPIDRAIELKQHESQAGQHGPGQWTM